METTESQKPEPRYYVYDRKVSPLTQFSAISLRYWVIDRTTNQAVDEFTSKAAANGTARDLNAIHELAIKAVHRLSISRTHLGRGAIKGSEMHYGTVGRCSCGDWRHQVNRAPSKGGRSHVTNLHATHLAAAIANEQPQP